MPPPKEQQRSKVKKATLRAFENYLVAKYERLASVPQTRSLPYVMTIDPTNVCQLRCPGCMTGLFNEGRKKKVKNLQGMRPPARLTPAVFDSIYDECGDTLFYCHFYNWGEPLFNEHLPYFIRSASERGIFTKMDTNLSLKCSDQKLEKLLTSGLDQLAVSIDGFSQETYEKYRVNGNFGLVLGNLKRLVALRDRLGAVTRICWNFLFFSFNEHEAAAISEFCDQHGIDFVPKDAVFTFKMPADWKPTHVREGKPNPYRRNRPLELSSADWTTPAGVLPLYVGKPQGRSCGWHYSYTVVNADGGVHPCCGLYNPALDFGHVTAEPGSFGRIWNGANFQAVRRDFPAATEANAAGPTTICTRCTHSEVYRNHYTVLDREIMVKYWSLDAASEVRSLDRYFALLQTSPLEFVGEFAARYADSTLPADMAQPRQRIPGNA